MRYVSASRAALVAALVGLLALPLASTALAADVTGGCTGSITSYDAAGNVIDNARGPGPGGTQADPLNLDPEGSLAWEASTPVPITSGTYAVGLSGSTISSGAIDNPDGKDTVSGVTGVSDLPSFVRPVLSYLLLTDAKAEVTASASGSGQSCTASVWVTGLGDTTGSPAFWMGAGVLILAAILLFVLFTTTTEIGTGASAAATATVTAPAGKE
jgi:hypothetical protein